MGKIGFVGLGAMGGGMAVNLATKCKDVVVFDIRPEACEAAVKAGATRVEVINASAGKNLMTEAWEGALMTFETMYGAPEARAVQLKINEKDIRAYLNLVKEVGTKSAAGEAVLNMVLSDDQVDRSWLDDFKAAMAK